MTKRLKVCLLVIIAAACLACTLVGCSLGGLTRSKATQGYNTHITYYSNGGSFNEASTLTVREIFLKGDSEGAPFFEITPTTSDMKVERGAHDFEGWYKPKRYTEGAHAGEVMYYILNDKGEKEPVYMLKNGDSIVTDKDTVRPVFAREKDGALVDEQILERKVFIECSDEKITNGEIIAPNRDDWFGLIVCAKWSPFAKISYKLVITDEHGNKVEDTATEYTTADGKEKFKNGDDLVSLYMDKATVTPIGTQHKALTGLTFVKTFPNSDLTGSLGPVRKEDGDVTVYCRYVLGDWTVVNNSESVKKMFGSLSGTDKYLITEDIAYSGTAINARLATARASNVTIVCDSAHTISGLKFNVPRAASNTYNYSIFGSLGSEFKVSGLTLKDISVTVAATNQTFYFYALCGAYADANPANIELTVENITATYHDYQGSAPFYNDLEDHWLFGGAESATDDMFLAQFTGVKVPGMNTVTAVQQ